MYLYHFGFSELPFTLTPNTGFYCGLQVHEEALQVLTTALKTGEGFIKVTGEVGTGKTLLCRKLLNEVSKHFVTAYVPNPFLTPHELRLAIAAELGVEFSKDTDTHQLVRHIEQRLLEINKNGQSVVLIIDEAQALPTESLEALRLFSNLETETRKLVQLVLFGQPELDERFAQRELRQFRQRIGFSYKLKTLTEAELKRYVHHRMSCAGYKGASVFSDKVIHWIFRGSQGVPRVANILCHKSLMLAYGNGRHEVTIADVKAAIADTEGAVMPKQQDWMWFGFGFVIMVTIVVAIAYSMGWITR
ncbi:ExeA family protein [Aliidiomarina haloalkalitolerans]|uniref:AAA family ATPase n=1 Tax=Aliidiomarina haloalkalitolerans TaxID=859059 RepID=A0A432VPJ3_9GAMM|nr:AAA family ATPase [Aliidiomarina haloalkalitolerans]RUO18077.1 AAA family ATPase [Aliidiomarina haloalkalitolerans]